MDVVRKRLITGRCAAHGVATLPTPFPPKLRCHRREKRTISFQVTKTVQAMTEMLCNADVPLNDHIWAGSGEGRLADVDSDMRAITAPDNIADIA